MTLSARADRRLVRATGDSRRYVLVELTAPIKERTTDRAPLNVAFILDRSGSMGGQKIALAREAVQRAVGALDARDRFCVVVYDEVIDVVIESTPASAESQAQRRRSAACDRRPRQHQPGRRLAARRRAGRPAPDR